MEFVGDVILVLETGFKLTLFNTFYVPSFRRNLVSISQLDHLGFSFVIKDFGINLIFNYEIIGTCRLSFGLYLMCLKPIEDNVFHVESITPKRPLSKEQSYTLWHKRLGHISKARVDRLIKFDILSHLDKELETSIDYCRGKLIRTQKKSAVRSTSLLEIVHADISGPYHYTLCRNNYFITFIDDFSRYGYVFLIKDKSESLDKFKIFRTEVEKQLGKSIKIVRSDRGGEYYGRHGDAGQLKDPFAKYLEDNGIIGQFTMPGTPEQNGVAERRNRTLMDMVRSMMSRANLSQF